MQDVRQKLLEEKSVLQEECFGLREQIKVQVNELERYQLDNNTILQEQNALKQATAENQGIELRHKEDVRRLEDSHADEIEKLEDQYEEETTRLQTVIQLSNEENSQLKQIEINKNYEIEKMEHVISSLKESNQLMKEHAKDSVSISEQYQQNLVELQGNLKVISS